MIEQISAEELKQKLDSKEDFTLVDCREIFEWEVTRIEGAILMPCSSFVNDYTNLNNKEATIVVQCRSGHRSMDVCNFLADKGYKKLYNLEDGILGWVRQGYPIIGD